MVVHAHDPLGFRFGLSQRRQEHASENGDDSDDDEELYESEGSMAVTESGVHTFGSLGLAKLPQK